MWVSCWCCGMSQLCRRRSVSCGVVVVFVAVDADGGGGVDVNVHGVVCVCAGVDNEVSIAGVVIT